MQCPAARDPNLVWPYIVVDFDKDPGITCIIPGWCTKSNVQGRGQNQDKENMEVSRIIYTKN